MHAFTLSRGTRDTWHVTKTIKAQLCKRVGGRGGGGEEAHMADMDYEDGTRNGEIRSETCSSR